MGPTPTEALDLHLRPRGDLAGNASDTGYRQADRLLYDEDDLAGELLVRIRSGRVAGAWG